jgi:hypothetical protein
MTEASADLRSTLQAGTATANALRGTLESWDRMTAHMAQEGVERTREGQPTRPFDVRDYTAMLQQLDQTTRQLNTLTRQLNSDLPALRATTNGVIDRLFRWLILFVLVCLLAAMVYRALAARISGR